jgi:histidine triad (HIT) family protein
LADERAGPGAQLENRDVTPMFPESPTDCIFCDIINRQAPASIVHEDALSLTFLDIRPINPGHLLIVPKRHLPSLANLDEATGAHLFRIAMRTAAALRHSGLPADGINLFLADGAAAFQEVFHLHLHVFPRFTGDAFRITADWSHTPSREELDRIAEAIRTALTSS